MVGSVNSDWLQSTVCAIKVQHKRVQRSLTEQQHWPHAKSIICYPITSMSRIYVCLYALYLFLCVNIRQDSVLLFTHPLHYCVQHVKHDSRFVLL